MIFEVPLPLRARALRVATFTMLLLALAACSSDDGATPPTTDPDVEDATTDADDPDAAPDADVEGPDPEVSPDDVDIDETTIPDDADTDDINLDELLPCTEQEDCQRGHYCVDDLCFPFTCRNEGNWVDCERRLNEIEPDYGRFAICREQLCIRACQSDLECGDGELCTDFGECVPFEGEITGIHPGGDAPAPLQVGLSNTLWNYPIGVPLGGYGERAAFDDGRYAASLRASAGTMHGLYIRSMVLDVGDRQFMFIRIPIIFIGADLHEAVARALQETTGRDWRDSLIISATHTHSGPCRHWALPEFAVAPLGAFGIGEYHDYFHELLLESTVLSAREALDDLQPAQLGWKIVEAFDMDDVIGRDRWRQTPPFDDNRVLLIRVDNMDDEPIAFMFSFGAHGTDNSSDYASGDVLGGAEQWLEFELGRRYGHFVNTMFINQNSGSMSPAAGVQGHRFPQTMERLGWAFTEKVLDEFLELETSTELSIRAHTHRFPINYDVLGYERGELAGRIGRPSGGEYHYGGLSCVGPFGGDDDYSTHQDPEQMNCGGALHFLLLNQPPTTMMASQITIGEFTQGDDSLTFLTQPGELAMELSWEIIRELRNEFGVDPLKAWTFGYANDHLLYLLPTNLRGERPPFPGLSLPHPSDTSRDADGFPNTPGAPDDYPDFAFSLLQGGYESTMSPWGYRTGDYMIHQALSAYLRLENPNAEISTPDIYPQQFTRRERTFPIDPTPAALAGSVVLEMPAEVTRLDPVEFAWVGGDPGAEMPQVPVVTLERRVDGTFEPVVLENTQLYTNLEPRFMTRVRETVDDTYEWVVRWEELKDFPTGTYRLVVSGHYLPEGAGAAITPYSLMSREFEVVPNTEMIVTSSIEGTTLSGTIGYPAATRMDFLDERRDRGAVTGHFRMRHPMVPTDVSDPPIADEDIDVASVTVTVMGRAETAEEATSLSTQGESVEGRGGVPVTRYTVDLSALGLPSGTHTLEVSVEDFHGNRGTSTVEYTAP